MDVVCVTGRLTDNAVVHGNEHKALRFNLASRYGWDKKEKKERVTFLPCTMFDPTEAMQNLLITKGKGMMVEIIGRLQTSNYESNGEMKYKTEIVINTLNIIPTGKKQDKLGMDFSASNKENNNLGNI